MKILAFDQATRVTGFAILEDGDLQSHGVLTAPTKLDILTRMYLMADRISDMIRVYQPDVVCFEGVEGVKNESTMIHLANLQGMCLISARRLGYEPRIVDVAHWRHKLGFQMGRGVTRDALKEQAVKFVVENYGLADCGDDEAEAICIAVAVNKDLDSKE